MGLIKCPDCEKMFSDRIAACPQCGCPIEEAIKEMQKQEEKLEQKIQPEPMPIQAATPAQVSPVVTDSITKFVPSSQRKYSDKEKVQMAYAESISQMLWIKGLITREEKAKIDAVSKEKLTSEQ